MADHTVLIISDNQADQLILSQCLRRANPPRFELAPFESVQQLPDALGDRNVDVIILAQGNETEYLLRLARKNDSTTPIILLVDSEDPELIAQARALGASDFLVRGQLQDSLVHRVLDYSIRLRDAECRIQQLSHRDPLTGVLNRAGFRAHMERAMDRSRRYGFNSALLHVNIDQFTNINDHYGEQEGDLLITTVSRRLVNKLRSTDSIARIGGDEFAIVLEDVASGEDVEQISDKMLKSIATPMILSEQQVSVDASIGAAVFPVDGDTFAELVECARSAMQQAKSIRGGKFVRYSNQITFNHGGSTSLAAELRAAVRKNQFELHYQPRIEVATGRLVGLEALLRWNHPDRGLLLPGEFIHACEDMGLLKTIGYQVIQHACSAQVWMAEQGVDDVDVAVNISFTQFQDEPFVEIVKDIVRRTGSDASRLEFELTESTILKCPEHVKLRMDELRQLGISFSLDDFGTGFSQLTHLTDLPIAALKIDACFVRDLPHNPQQEAICNMIIEMGRRMGMQVVAEGAETFEQIEYLRESHCQQVQGFYYSPAFPLQQLPRFMQEQQFRRENAFIS